LMKLSRKDGPHKLIQYHPGDNHGHTTG